MNKKIIKDKLYAKGLPIEIYTEDYQSEFISLTDIRCLSSKLSHLTLNQFKTDLFSINEIFNFSFAHRVKAHILW